MESFYHDPFTQQLYDLTIHIPYILPCCGETCAITTIHDARSTTNRCPFCNKALPDAGWLVNKAICQMLSAETQSQPHLPSKAPDHDDTYPSHPKNLCAIHHDQKISMICINDNTLLCSKCMTKTNQHVGHLVEDLTQFVQVLQTGLVEVKPKMAALRARCEQTLEKLYNEAKMLIQTKLDEQIAESERIIEQLLLLETSPNSSPKLSFWNMQALCRKMQEIDVEKTAARLEEEMRTRMERWVNKEFHCISEETQEIKGECLKTIQGHSEAVRCLQVLSSAQIASGSEDNTIKIWDTLTATCIKSLQGHTGWIIDLKMLPSGLLVSGSVDNSIKLWNRTNGTCLNTLRSHTNSVLCLQVLPSGQLASGSSENTIKIWSPRTGACLRTIQGHTDWVRCLQILLSSQLASGADDSLIKIWNYTTGTCLNTLQGHHGAIYCLQVLPSGHLASGSHDRTLKIWDTAIGTCLTTLQGHENYVVCLMMLPSGYLASGSDDNTVKIWDTAAATCLQTLRGHAGPVDCLQILPSGQLVSGSDDHDIKIWV